MLRVRGDGDRHSCRYQRFEPVKVLVPESDATLGCTCSGSFREAGTMDSDTRESRCAEADEPRSVSTFTLTGAVAEVMRPCVCGLNLLHGECSFRSAAVTTALFLTQILPDAYRSAEDGVIALIDDIKLQRGFVNQDTVGGVGTEAAQDSENNED